MITDLILRMFGGLANSIISLFPTIQLPAWMQNVGSFMGTVFGYAGLMSAWFPTGLAVAVILSVLVVWGAAFALKASRIAVSHLTGGGGGAG